MGDNARGIYGKREGVERGDDFGGAEINLERRRRRLEDGVGGTAAAVAFSSCVVVYAERPLLLLLIPVECT